MTIEQYPTFEGLVYECGALAGHIYGNKNMVYYRVTPEGKERLTVVNGMVVSHALEYSEFQIVKNLELEGVWVFGMGLVSEHGYKLIRSFQLDE